MPEHDPARLLKVAPDAPLDEVKRAYRRAALAHHPDQNPHPDAARHFRRLTEAYRILEAQARKSAPPKARVLAPRERLAYLLGDVEALVKRWPAARWSRTVDGLPAAVWVAGSLEVLARLWPEAGAPPTVTPSPDALAVAVGAWREALGRAADLPGHRTEALTRALADIERRLGALERPPRAQR